MNPTRGTAVFALAAVLHTAGALAQLAPERACVTLDKPIRATASIPAAPAPPSAGTDAPATTATPRVLLLDPSNPATPLDARAAPAAGGSIDLAELFPRLWAEPSPGVRAAQLEVNGNRIGPAVLLIPMLPPVYAPRLDRLGAPVFVTPAEPMRAFSGYWLLIDKLAAVSTDHGQLTFRLRADLAPRSVMAFRALVEHGFYDDTPILRVASLRARPEPDIVQLGDPTGTGLGGPGALIDLEPSTLKHGYGTLSLARTADPNSASSQLIIGLSREGTAQLDGKYAAFGEMVGEKSVEALAKLAKTPVNADGKPKDTVIVDRIELIDAPPLGRGEQPAKDPAAAPPGGR